MKKIIILAVIAMTVIACGGNKNKKEKIFIPGTHLCVIKDTNGMFLHKTDTDGGWPIDTISLQKIGKNCFWIKEDGRERIISAFLGTVVGDTDIEKVWVFSRTPYGEYFFISQNRLWGGNFAYYKHDAKGNTYYPRIPDNVVEHYMSNSTPRENAPFWRFFSEDFKEIWQPNFLDQTSL